MQSLKELYKIGRGPSSSHTMGPERAAKIMKSRWPDADKFIVTLFGSLALTGKGHCTDEVLRKTFAPAPCEVIFDKTSPCPVHPNTLDIRAERGGKELATTRFYSVGGGTIRIEGEPGANTGIDEGVYPLSTYDDISAYCKSKNIRLWQYVQECEGDGIFGYLGDIWEQMKASIHEGLTTSGVLPGCLGTQRRAQHLYNQRHIDESAQTKENRLVCSYAFAVSEQNAAGGVVVTAPTCGSCGVLPGALYYIQKEYKIPEVRILRALLTAGIVGNIVKTNGSISGAEVGCQGEVGVACAMAGAAVCYLLGGSIYQAEYAAEMGLEHHLGLTCDPLMGLVQIPCIERNGFACMRAIDHASYALAGDGRHKISFDDVVEVMMETGHALPSLYRETSMGGLARVYEV